MQRDLLAWTALQQLPLAGVIDLLVFAFGWASPTQLGEAYEDRFTRLLEDTQGPREQLAKAFKEALIEHMQSKMFPSQVQKFRQAEERIRRDFPPETHDAVYSSTMRSLLSETGRQNHAFVHDTRPASQSEKQATYRLANEQRRAYIWSHLAHELDLARTRGSAFLSPALVKLHMQELVCRPYRFGPLPPLSGAQTRLGLLCTELRQLAREVVAEQQVNAFTAAALYQAIDAAAADWARNPPV